jgi:hypothetical protein
MAAEGTDEPSVREPADVAAAKPAGPDLAALLPIVGLGVAVWASLPKYSGPKLNVEASKEVADHIIPAIVVLLASLAGIMAGRRADGPGGTRFIAGMVVLLAGLWMLATHLPLVAEAMRDQAPWPATIYHTAAALAVFGLGLLWSVATWSEAGDESQAPAKAKK